MKVLTLEQFHAALKAQGVPRNHVAFICPRCGTVQSMQDFLDTGKVKDMEAAEKYIGFSCIGRCTHMKPPPKHKGTQVGCDWTLGGLFSLHALEVEIDGKRRPSFDVATPEQAQANMNKKRGPGSP